MKFLRIFWSGVRRAVSQVHPVHRCLLLFAAILLAQSAYSLFFPMEDGPAQHIDTMVRTALASIFGYFLSANFDREEEPLKTEEQPEVRAFQRASFIQEELPAGEAVPEPVPQPSEEIKKASRPFSCFQVVLSTVMGMVCLVSLILLRSFPELAEQVFSGPAAATVTQFRDLVSGCIGFLIGCPIRRSPEQS